MRTWSKTGMRVISCLVAVLAATTARAADLKVVIVGGPVPMTTLAPAFERVSGHKIASSVDSVPAMLRRINDGEEKGLNPP